MDDDLRIEYYSYPNNTSPDERVTQLARLAVAMNQTAENLSAFPPDLPESQYVSYAMSACLGISELSRSEITHIYENSSSASPSYAGRKFLR